MLAVCGSPGGVRIAHFAILFALAIPVLWSKIEKLQYALLRLMAFLDPGSHAVAGELPAQAVAHRHMNSVAPSRWLNALS